jgi:hypothetical protein
MNVQITSPTYLPTSATPYAAGTCLEVPSEWFAPATMTRIGTAPGAQLSARVALSTLVPGMAPVAAN